MLTLDEKTQLIARAIKVRQTVCSMRNELQEIFDQLDETDELSSERLNALEEALNGIEDAEGKLDDVFTLNSFPGPDPKTWRDNALADLENSA